MEERFTQLGKGFTLVLALFVGAAAASHSMGSTGPANGQTAAPNIVAVGIVLPPRIVAGRLATLAALGADRKLAAHVSVELGNGLRVQTDATGRANFTAPAPGVLLAKAGAASAATLVDPVSASGPPSSIVVGPFASLRGEFSICGGGFRGDAEGDQVQIDDQPALILAASPECIVVAPNPKMPPGLGRITVETSGAPRHASTTLVSLDFALPQPALTPGKKGWLTLHARGSDQRLRILVNNDAPDVLRFDKGDAQEVLTSGGLENLAAIRVVAMRSGDFSFRARILPQPDVDAARRFLEAAEPLAIADVPRSLKNMENDLRHSPQNSTKVRAQLDRMLLVTSPSDFRTLLEAARLAL